MFPELEPLPDRAGRSPRKAAPPGPQPTPDNRLQGPLQAQFDAVPPTSGWRALLDPFVASPEGQALVRRVDAAVAAGLLIYPAQVFAALQRTPRQQVRVVILGQDPYHGPGQAEGLSFSVPPGLAIPPSLRNIRKEIARDLGLPAPAHGHLGDWADAGVLLLNTVLTVQAEQAASHAGWGWERLTDQLMQAVAADPGPKVFMLWGAHAQRKRAGIEQARAASGHAATDLLVLQSNHPSPLSATRPPAPFVGNGHFGQAQRFLAERGVSLGWALQDF
ncbi:uracil-DNA glycosylase [Aquabacterium lacunae]|uniref:uracil-DNA glycosylase n=1 Tax=Aquabacterium lacunae TaxID=2528630 RepID=UPI003CCADB34